MSLQFISEPPSCLPEYARVPIAFEVTERLEPVAPGRVGWSWRTRPVAQPYVKDYDAHPGQHPRDWTRRGDLGDLWFAAALLHGRRVGGAAVVMNAATTMGDIVRQADVALLWDLRVAPDCRRRGVGRALLAFAESHARANGRRGMAVETQDINVPACRFYASADYTLTHVNPRAYPNLPDEAQLIWQKDL